MKREGSPWTGLGVVCAKEVADHLGSVRMRILEVLMVLAATGATYVAGQQLHGTVEQGSFAFLKLFTTASQPLPSFVSFLSFFIPLVAIGLGFDAVNGEHNRGTLSLVLSQPIYRDALLAGKFLAAMVTLLLVLVGLWLLTTGLGIVFLGLPPSGDSVARGLCFFVATLFYAGIWLAVAMLCSVLFRQTATSALAALGVWLLFVVLWPIGAQFVAQVVHPAPFGSLQALLARHELATALSRVSPNTLYSEAVTALLHPAVRSLGPVFAFQLYRAVLGTALPLGQSLVLVWPQLTSLVAGVVLLFTATYLIFQRREIRA
ncbi:MAG TPA: ABC transporter permease [Gammaproteobacteria bacterium]|nr:ABC transporter permease [Gammaproteobacteria bacterium]